jgi:ABC-type multidrug transport system permease subunit
MIRSAWPVYYRELLLLRRRAGRLASGMLVAPFLYMIAFGHGMGQGLLVDGVSYAVFLLPGLTTMTVMTQSFGLASDINIARFYWRIFEEIQAAPVSPTAYVLGEVLAGMTRGAAATLAVLGMGLLFGQAGHVFGAFLLALALNAWFFSCAAVAVAMVVRSHGDQALLTTFLITPMAFLGGTFFPVDKLPLWAKSLTALIPLSHAAQAARQAFLGLPVEWWRLGLLALLGALAFWVAVVLARRAVE